MQCPHCGKEIEYPGGRPAEITTATRRKMEKQLRRGDTFAAIATACEVSKMEVLRYAKKLKIVRPRGRRKKAEGQ